MMLFSRKSLVLSSVLCLAAGCSDFDGEWSTILTSGNIDQSQFQNFTLAEVQNNPEAGDPSYGYLRTGMDALVVELPAITDLEASLLVQQADDDAPYDFETVAPGEYSENGFTFDDTSFNAAYVLTINPSVKYIMMMKDFDDELVFQKAMGTFDEVARSIQGEVTFYPSGTSRGVVHDITIKAVVNGEVVSELAPFSVEVRDPS